MARDYLVLHTECDVCKHPFMKNVVREARRLGMKVVVCSTRDGRKLCRVALRTGVPAIVVRDGDDIRVVAAGVSRVLEYLEKKRLGA